jgi:hypothetical protein
VPTTTAATVSTSTNNPPAVGSEKPGASKFVYWCFEQAARRLNEKSPMPALFGAAAFETWAQTSKKLVATPARGDVFVKEHRHGGLVTGPALPGGTFPSVEGNTWARSDYAHRREGVYVLEKEKALRCTFARLA